MFTKFLTAALIALPFFVQSALARSDCTRSYVVRKGEDCDGISAANNVSTYQLAVNNPNINPSCGNLVPGSTLCLGYPNEDCTTTHAVIPGDTCDAIVSNFKINSTILYSNNPQINPDCTNIYVGEVLCTAGQVQVPPAPAGPTPATTIPATATPANPVATPANDDENLPFCDEL